MDLIFVPVDGFKSREREFSQVGGVVEMEMGALETEKMNRDQNAAYGYDPVYKYYGIFFLWCLLNAAVLTMLLVRY